MMFQPAKIYLKYYLEQKLNHRQGHIPNLLPYDENMFTDKECSCLKKNPPFLKEGKTFLTSYISDHSSPISVEKIIFYGTAYYLRLPWHHVTIKVSRNKTMG